MTGVQTCALPILQMSLVLVHSTKRRVIRVGRLAGQYAKPRSSNDETIDGTTLPSYRGDLVNDIEFSKIARTPNPNRSLRGRSEERRVGKECRSRWSPYQ